MTAEDSLRYEDETWAWVVAHEAELWAATEPLLGSTDRADIDRVASQGERLVEGGPTAAGYFVGVRIVEAYVARHGAESWKDLFDLPVREVLEQSGYGTSFHNANTEIHESR